MENTLATKLVILYSMAKAPDEFMDWFKDKPDGMELFGMPTFAEVVQHCAPGVFRDLARALYERVEVSADYRLTFIAKAWCAAWA